MSTERLSGYLSAARRRIPDAVKIYALVGIKNLTAQDGKSG
jgi:hypothetical protein